MSCVQSYFLKFQVTFWLSRSHRWTFGPHGAGPTSPHPGSRNPQWCGEWPRGATSNIPPWRNQKVPGLISDQPSNNARLHSGVWSDPRWFSWWIGWTRDVNWIWRHCGKSDRSEGRAARQDSHFGEDSGTLSWYKDHISLSSFKTLATFREIGSKKLFLRTILLEFRTFSDSIHTEVRDLDRNRCDENCFFKV